MRGKLIGYGTLVAVLLWLVLSYAPLALPQVAFPRTAADGLYGLAGIVVALFAAIQLVIAARTPSVLRASRQQPQPIARSLSMSSELFWTLLPLVVTVVLAVVWMVFSPSA